MRDRLLELGFPAERSIMIANGIDLAPFAGADGAPLAARHAAVIMVARFGAQKDHPTLIRAVDELRRRGLTPPVCLAGGGRQRHRARAEGLVKELGLEGQVQFCGLLRDVPQRLRQVRVAVLSTRYEGMPLALIEAMAAGCAVVGTRVPGVREILRHGENGLLCEPGDPRSLADALGTLLSDEQTAERVAAAGRQEALVRFGRERMNAEYEQLFQTPCSRQAGRRD